MIKNFQIKSFCYVRLLTRSFPGLINGTWHGIKGQLVMKSQDKLAKHKEFIRNLSKKLQGQIFYVYVTSSKLSVG